jgi:hypothetical protein
VTFYRYAALHEEIESIIVAEQAPAHAMTVRGVERQSASRFAGAAPDTS